MKKMAITYVTCSENGLYGLRYLLRKGRKISKVVTISADVAAKNLVSGYVDIAPICKAGGIELVVLEDYVLRAENLASHETDLLVVNGWNRLISGEVVSSFEYGGLGIHAGHPPIGHGRAPLPWNIIKGFKEIEVYVFRLTEHADDGDILAIHAVEITPHDTVQTLYEKVMYRGAILFDRVLKDVLNDSVRSFKQCREDIVVYPKRTSDDGMIDFTLPVEDIFNFVRAQSHPYPGAFSFMDGSRWHIWKAIPFDRYSFEDEPRIPGRVVAVLPSGMVVQTGSSPLWILDATCEGHTVVPTDLDTMEQYVGLRLVSEPS